MPDVSIEALLVCADRFLTTFVIFLAARIQGLDKLRPLVHDMEMHFIFVDTPLQSQILRIQAGRAFA